MSSSKHSPIFSHSIKVRYAETDQMGIVHHSVYPIYLEEARTELWNSLGYNYSLMEKEGYIVPVLEISIRYMKPAFYEDILSINIMSLRFESKLVFRYDYEIRRGEELLSTAYTKHVFLNREFKPIKPPRKIVDMVRKLVGT